MLRLVKFDSLTKRIETQIVAGVREAAPGKYWTYWTTDKLARIGIYGTFWMIFAYVLTAKFFVVVAGSEAPMATLVGGFATAIMVCCGIGVVATIIRQALHTDLVRIADVLWQARIK